MAQHKEHTSQEEIKTEMQSEAVLLHKGLQRRVHLWNLANGCEPHPDLKFPPIPLGKKTLMDPVALAWDASLHCCGQSKPGSTRWLQLWKSSSNTTKNIVERLLMAGIYPDDNPLLLHHAVTSQHWSTSRALLEAGAHVYPVEGSCALLELLIIWHDRCLEVCELYPKTNDFDFDSRERDIHRICMLYGAQLARESGDLIEQLVAHAPSVNEGLQIAHRALALAVLCSNLLVANKLLKLKDVSLKKACECRQYWQACYLEHVMKTKDRRPVVAVHKRLSNPSESYLVSCWEFLGELLEDEDAMKAIQDCLWASGVALKPSMEYQKTLQL